MSIDLRQCVPGQKLRSVHGTILTYVDDTWSNEQWPHRVLYPDGSHGTRTHDGFVFSNPEKRLPEDEDIVEIIPLETE